MALDFRSPLQLNALPPLGLALEQLGSAPSSPQPGRIYFDTTLGWARYCLSATGPTWVELKDITAAGLSDLAATVQAYRLDQFAAPTASVGFGNQRLTAVADPTNPTDAANQQYVTNYVLARINGLDWKNSVRAMASGNISLSAAPSSVDGVTLTTGDRVLLNGQSTGADNGIYDFNGAGNALTRSSDVDANAEVTGGLTVFVTEGTALHDTIWSLTTNNAITVGTTTLAFQQIGAGTSYTALSPITLVGNQFQLGTVPLASGGTGATTAAGARTALGVAQQGFASDVGALTAGVSSNLAHGLGTADLVVMVRNKSTGAMVFLDTSVDSTNITLTSAIAVSSGVLRVTAVAVA